MNTPRTLTVALAGNPNSGKTTLFNGLTGARGHVGNYPGVTVEIRAGERRHGNAQLTIVDLPGTYSLAAHSAEEHEARRLLVEQRPDIVVDVVDASNLERNLYLATQLMELKLPMVIALNMSDVARARGQEMDLPRLSALLGLPIVPTVGSTGEGLDVLLDTLAEVAEGRRGTQAPWPSQPHYGREIEDALAGIQAALRSAGGDGGPLPLRWRAIQLLENDPEAAAGVTSEPVRTAVARARAQLQALFRDPPEILMAERRYGYISGACQEATLKTVETRHTRSDQMDAILTHPLLGLPILLVLMFLVFQLTFTLGAIPMGWLDRMFDGLAGLLWTRWPPGAPAWLRSLLVDGVIGGVGTVVTFLPNILILFLAIAWLEDSGYMARAVFLMDRWMHRMGLHGKSFIPLLLGFGCTVPAMMATRILESRRDRLLTLLILPLMSCGAKLTVYSLFIPIFFPAPWRAWVMLSIYLAGILLAIAAAQGLRRAFFREDSMPFIMELPPYRLPTLKSSLLHTWERGWLYLKKAGTVILGFSILFWLLATFPRLPAAGPGGGGAAPADALAHSAAGRIGRALEPVLRPMGFDWRIGTALVGSLAAKELLVAQLGVIFSVAEGERHLTDLQAQLRRAYSPLTAFCVLLFTLIATPCAATVAVAFRESRSWKWTLFQWGGLTLLAFAVTTLVYQAGRLWPAGLRWPAP